MITPLSEPLALLVETVLASTSTRGQWPLLSGHYLPNLSCRGRATGKRVQVRDLVNITSAIAEYSRQANMGAKNHAVLMPDGECIPMPVTPLMLRHIQPIRTMLLTRSSERHLALLVNVAWPSPLVCQTCVRVLSWPDLTRSEAVLVGNAQSWLPELVERVRKLKVDQGFEQGADLYAAALKYGKIGTDGGFAYHSGPVISSTAKQRITGLIASAEEEGGIIALDGRGYEVPGYPDGNWVGPTIIEATTTMRCYRYVHYHPDISRLFMSMSARRSSGPCSS